MIGRIESYYKSELGAEEKRWVLQNLSELTSEECDKYIDVLGREYKRNKGSPDIASMTKALQAVRNVQKKFFWAVCIECGCEYDYRLAMCPKCYERGFKCVDKEVKVSSFKPPMSVVRYNKTFLKFVNDKGQKEMSCYNCEGRELSYCPNFGNPDWNCHEYRECKCKACCSMERRANAKLKESKGARSYAIPLGGADANRLEAC